MTEFLKIMAIRSDGERMEYESDEWGVLGVDGLDFSEIEVFREPRGFGHGDLITGRRKRSRDITIQAKLRKPQLYVPNRQRIIGFHNSNFTYDLYFTHLDTVRIAKDCVLNAASYGVVGRGSTPVLNLMYTAPDSDLFADNAEVTNFTLTTPLWHDTRVYTQGGGTLAFGEIKTTTTKEIEYLGSEPAPVKVKVEFTGYDDNLQFILGSRTVDVPGTFYDGEVIVIDTGTRTVKKGHRPYDETQATSLDIDPRLLYKMQMEYGINTVEVKSKNHAFRSELWYIGRYNGI